MEYVISRQEVVDNGDAVGASCIICGDPVLFSHDEFERYKKGLHIDSKVCNQCKAAVKWAKIQRQKYYKEIVTDDNGESKFEISNIVQSIR